MHLTREKEKNEGKSCTSIAGGVLTYGLRGILAFSMARRDAKCSRGVLAVVVGSGRVIFDVQ